MTTTDVEYPQLLQPVLDCVSPRQLADFYRELLGYRYRPGDEGSEETDWLVLLKPSGERGLAFQQVDELPATTWPEPGVPQQIHLDMTVDDVAALNTQHERALALGAKLMLDRTEHPVEPLRVYADPAGHLFCIFVY